VCLYREHRSALAIVDIVMSEKEGIETVRDLVIDPDAVIFMMSWRDGSEDSSEVAMMLGAKRGFRKPVRIEELLAAIQGQR